MKLSRILGVLFLIAMPLRLLAGGPEFVSGSTYFNSMGTPLTWPNGVVIYYTDQGNLSPILPGPAADALVADAFNQWNWVITAAVNASSGGHLAEDVNGNNVYLNNGSLLMPADIEPGATSTPVGIVYDYDGSVTDALLGQGAGDADACFTNAAFGGVDNFNAQGNLLHALVVLNGNCAVTSSQIPDLEYRLVRVLGRVLGLSWSQANLNVITQNPPPIADDYLGFSIMHAVDPMNCTPIALCYSNNGQVSPYSPKADDEAAISRLYPVTTANLSSNPGKRLFYETEGEISGTVYFSGANPPPMQGVNVVARFIDPVSHQPSRRYVIASVSGFLFTGNAGTLATGFENSLGDLFSDFGSNDTTVEGYFDLAGLPFPNVSYAQYQLTVEALDPAWSQTVAPYGPWQVAPSGLTQPIVVGLSEGANVHQDIYMQNSAEPATNPFGPTSYDAPAALPTSGNWVGTLSDYGQTDYLAFSAQVNRTLSVELTALDENGAPTENKALPVAGLWALADPGVSPAPANTPSAFNTLYYGVTRLDATTLQSTSLRLGISDLRGDGRPDYRYQARLFYGDHIAPVRASAGGGTPVSISGYGFAPNTTVSIGTTSVPVMVESGSEVVVDAPAMPDGVRDITLTEPSLGGSSLLSGVLTYGAAPTDSIVLLSGGNPNTPVGGQALNPIRVEVLSADGVTPVAGASVYFVASPAVSFSACNGATSCTVLTNGSGIASTYMTPLSAGSIAVYAELAPASYSPAKQVQTTLTATESSLDLAVFSANQSIAQGATLTLPLTARVLSNGVPVAGKTLDYFLTQGPVTFTPHETTDSNGYAVNNLQITNMTGSIQMSVCVAPGDVPCQNFYAFTASGTMWRLLPVGGETQLLPVGQNFLPVAVQATDSSNPPNPVLGVPVSFQSILARENTDGPTWWIGDTGISGEPEPVILGSSETTVLTDIYGMAAWAPSTNGVSGAVIVVGSASAGVASVPFQLQSVEPVN
jgi:hypothetical protein